MKFFYDLYIEQFKLGCKYSELDVKYSERCFKRSDSLYEIYYFLKYNDKEERAYRAWMESDIE